MDGTPGAASTEKDKAEQPCNDTEAEAEQVTRRVRFLHTIEKNWECRTKDSLPIDLVPRRPGPNGSRADHKHPDKKRLSPGDWPTKLYKSLAHLSGLTVNDMKFAHAQLDRQVKTRQRKRVHREHYAREALTSDIEAAVKEFGRLISVHRYTPQGADSVNNAVVSGKWRDAPGISQDGSKVEDDMSDYGTTVERNDNDGLSVESSIDQEEGGVKLPSDDDRDYMLLEFKAMVDAEAAELRRRLMERYGDAEQ